MTISAVQMIHIAQLHESPLNPRTIVDEAEDAKLLASIVEHGILQSLVVRPHPREEGAYEVVIGNRRRRMAERAGLEGLPCHVRELDDARLIELALTENKQRGDLHPLDEARGYDRLRTMGMEVAVIAARAGQEERYVYRRMKLLDLTEDAVAAFMAGHITVAHAEELARLQEKDQKKALAACLQMSDFAHDPEKGMVRVEPFAQRALSVRALREWIAEHLHLDLAAAPFPAGDADLLPVAGACAACPKRTGANPGLFGDIAHGDTCTDPHCFKRKEGAWVKRMTKEMGFDVAKPLAIRADEYSLGRALGTNRYKVVKRRGECEHVRPGLYVDGKKKDQMVAICAEPSCNVHHPKKKGEPAGAGSNGSGFGIQKSPEQIKAEQAERRVEQAVRCAVLGRILDAVAKDGLNERALRIVVLAQAEGMVDAANAFQFLAARWDWPDVLGKPGYPERAVEKRIGGLKESGLMQAMVALAASPELDAGLLQTPTLKALASAYGLSYGDINKEVRGEMKLSAPAANAKGEEELKAAKRKGPLGGGASNGKAAAKKGKAKKKGAKK